MEMKQKSETLSYRMPCYPPYSNIRSTSHQRNETLRKMGRQTSCVRFQCGSIEFIQTISKTLKNDCRTRWVVLASQIDQNDCTMSILKITHQFLHFSFVRLWMWWVVETVLIQMSLHLSISKQSLVLFWSSNSFFKFLFLCVRQWETKFYK